MTSSVRATIRLTTSPSFCQSFSITAVGHVAIGNPAKNIGGVL